MTASVAEESAIPNMLETVKGSLLSAISSLPSTADANSDSSIIPPTDGISLLDTKSEILLSYLQNLVYLVLLQVRQLSSQGTAQNGTSSSTAPGQEEVARKLTELRVYLERGVRPLEGRLKYQIDKVLKAAEDVEQTQKQASQKKKSKKSKQTRPVSGSGSESEGGTSEEDDDDEEDDEDVDELAYRPNLTAFSRAAEQQEKEKANQKKSDSHDGIYRPPKIKPTALPETTSIDRRADRAARFNSKSRAIDEFVNSEMSAAPMVEPSIGSTIRAGGRQVTSQKDREKEMERTSYEETNLIRLPKENKKERARRGGNRPGGYGGEDWRSLGQGADRIERLTRGNRSSGSALDRSRKRRATEDGPRGDGINIGEGFEKRRKKVAGWKK